MFDYRTAAPLQQEKQHRFSKEAERDHEERRARDQRPTLVDRLLDAVGRRLVSVGKALSYEERSGRQAAAAQGHGPS